MFHTTREKSYVRFGTKVLQRRCDTLVCPKSVVTLNGRTGFFNEKSVPFISLINQQTICCAHHILFVMIWLVLDLQRTSSYTFIRRQYNGALYCNNLDFIIFSVIFFCWLYCCLKANINILSMFRVASKVAYWLPVPLSLCNHIWSSCGLHLQGDMLVISWSFWPLLFQLPVAVIIDIGQMQHGEAEARGRCGDTGQQFSFQFF